MQIYIETPRLILRDWKEEDISAFARMNADPHVMEFFLNPLTPEESLAFYHRIQNEFQTCGFGLYAVERKEDHAFIGYTGFHQITFDVDFAPGVEIGWRLAHEYWGHGYAPEAALACLEYARKYLDIQTIFSFTSLPNLRSERVMQKIGMERMKEFNHPLVPQGHALCRHVVYHIELKLLITLSSGESIQRRQVFSDTFSILPIVVFGWRRLRIVRYPSPSVAFTLIVLLSI